MSRADRLYIHESNDDHACDALRKLRPDIFGNGGDRRDEKDIPEEIRMKLGEALSYGSEIISSYSFFHLFSNIKNLTKKDIENSPHPYVVEQGKHGKNILTGNMGINLHSVKSGKVPVFHTPPEARGEDAIFALQLKNTEVREVGSFIFHDPFVMYPEMAERKFPEYLKAVPVNTKTKERFGRFNYRTTCHKAKGTRPKKSGGD